MHFSQKRWWNSLIISENQIFCFPSFGLTVFRDFTSFTATIVLWKILMEPFIAFARWWPCACLNCDPGLGGLEETSKKFSWIQVYDLVLKLGWNINEGNSSQLLFYFIVLMVTIDSVIGRSIFSFVSGLKLKFSRNALWRKSFQLDSKSNLSKAGNYLEFLARLNLLSSTSYLHGLKIAWVAQLLIFLTTSIFFDSKFESYSGLFFKIACTF